MDRNGFDRAIIITCLVAMAVFACAGMGMLVVTHQYGTTYEDNRPCAPTEVAP